MTPLLALCLSGSREVAVPRKGIPGQKKIGNHWTTEIEAGFTRWRPSRSFQNVRNHELDNRKRKRRSVSFLQRAPCLGGSVCWRLVGRESCARLGGILAFGPLEQSRLFPRNDVALRGGVGLEWRSRLCLRRCSPRAEKMMWGCVYG